MSEVLSDYTGKVNREKVLIAGIEFELGEFSMRLRALWSDIAEEYNLAKLQSELQTNIIPQISSLASDVESDPRVISAQGRLQRLQDKHDDLLDLYSTDDEPEDIDEQLDKVVDRMANLKEEMSEIADIIRLEIIEKAKWADETVSELMRVQDEARIKFVWTVAKDKELTEQDFEEFLSSCNSEDYKSAERWLSEGNAPWASLYTGRMQEKPKKKMVN